MKLFRLILDSMVAGLTQLARATVEAPLVLSKWLLEFELRMARRLALRLLRIAQQRARDKEQAPKSEAAFKEGAFLLWGVLLISVVAGLAIAGYGIARYGPAIADNTPTPTASAPPTPKPTTAPAPKPTSGSSRGKS